MPYIPPKISPLFGEDEGPTGISVVVGPVALVVVQFQLDVAAYYYYYYQTQTQSE